MEDILSFAKSRKFYVAVIGFVLALFNIYWPGALWYAPLIAALTAAGVFGIPNAVSK